MAGKKRKRERLPRERLEDTNKPTENMNVGRNILTKPGPGRPPGSLNKMPARITEAVLEGFTRYGEDGNGTNGLPGFFYRIARDDLKAAAAITTRLLPQRVQTSVDPQSALGQVLEAARARLQYERTRAITVQATPVTKS
jgi:hypothetical protein